MSYYRVKQMKFWAGGGGWRGGKHTAYRGMYTNGVVFQDRFYCIHDITLPSSSVSLGVMMW